MSQFDSTHPSIGDNDTTRRVKDRIKDKIDEVFTDKKYKAWIVEEVPYYAVEEEKPYHLDLCILARNKLSYDNYCVFAIEIDGKTHESKISAYKDYSKDRAFHTLGIPILRIRVEDVLYGNEIDSMKEMRLGNMIWDFFMEPKQLEFSTRNQNLAIKLKENQLPLCRNKKCQHKAYEHNLAGCNYQQPNKLSLYCPCKEPFMVSDM